MFDRWIQAKLNRNIDTNKQQFDLPQNTSVDYLYVEEENHVWFDYKEFYNRKIFHVNQKSLDKIVVHVDH